MGSPTEKKNTSVRWSDETQGLLRQLRARGVLANDQSWSVDQDAVLLAALRLADKDHVAYLTELRAVLAERQ